MNQLELNKYFSTQWQSETDRYQYTGWNLINEVNTGEYVLDVGCGENLFRDKIPNLIGIDPAFPQADYCTTIEDFKIDQQFDVAFCLGSINFGTQDQIIHQIKCVVKLLKPNARIYWRCNPGIPDHGNNDCNNINFFPWTPETHNELSKYFGFECYDIKVENHKQRIYAKWVRLA